MWEVCSGNEDLKPMQYLVEDPSVRCRCARLRVVGTATTNSVCSDGRTSFLQAHRHPLVGSSFPMAPEDKSGTRSFGLCPHHDNLMKWLALISISIRSFLPTKPISLIH